MNERKQIYLATTLRIILSIILVILGVLSLVFLHGYRFSYTIYVPVLLGCIAIALFLLCSCFMLGIFYHKNIEQEKINNVKKWINIFSAGISFLVFVPVIIIDFFAFNVHPLIIFVSFFITISISVILTVFGIVKCISAYREPDLTDVILYQGTTCPCRKTNCIYHGNCTACIEKHRSKNKPTRCERLKAKLTKKGRGGVVMDSEDYEREKAEKKLLIKLQEAEEEV